MAPDLIKGGLASGRRPDSFDQAQLRRGTEVEIEHVVRPGVAPTNKDLRIAREIAMDHLVEHPRYYDYLEEAEKKMAKNRSKRLVQAWVKSTQGVGVDELYLAKRYAQARADHHGKTQAIYKEEGRSMWYVDAASKSAGDPAQIRFVQRVEPKATNVAKRTNRTSNTHDASKSLRQFQSALAAAERELLSANESLEKRQWKAGLNRMIRATFWLGTARAEMQYAPAQVSASDRNRIKELEKRSKNWGGDFLKEQQTADPVLSQIVEVMYPHGDPDAEWSAGTIEDVAEVLRSSGLTPS